MNDGGSTRELLGIQQAVSAKPECPAKNSLLPVLDLCLACSRQDTTELASFLQRSDLRTGLRETASLEQLHLIAQDNDTLDAYVSFLAENADLPAGGFAVLRLHELAYYSACQSATIDAFDTFVDYFPDAVQAEQARTIAYDLEVERAVWEADDSNNRREGLEQIAKRMFVQARQAAREGRYLKAERLFRILVSHPEFSTTDGAIEATNSKDRRDFEAKLLSRLDRINDSLGKINESLDRISAHMGDLVETQKEQNDTLREIAANSYEQIQQMKAQNQSLNSLNRTGTGIKKELSGIGDKL